MQENVGWAGVIRTRAFKSQNLEPYHLATTHSKTNFNFNAKTSKMRLVGKMGFEPINLSARVFETLMYAIPSFAHINIISYFSKNVKYNITGVKEEIRTLSSSSTDLRANHYTTKTILS